MLLLFAIRYSLFALFAGCNDLRSRTRPSNSSASARASPDAGFRDGQEEAIRHVVEGRGRLLVVQKTGWGKSFVYFIATKLLREGGNGPALLVSPLLALMRNQIAAAERMGVRAATINSDNQDEWERRRSADSPRRDRHPADLARASGQRTVPHAGARGHRGDDLAAGDRRSPLHLRLGPRLPAALPAAGADRQDAAAKPSPAGDHRDRQQSGDGGSRSGAGAEPQRVARRPEPNIAVAADDSPARARPNAWPGWPSSSRRSQGHGIIYTLTVRDADQVADWLKSRGLQRRGLHRRHAAIAGRNWSRRCSTIG